jgi:uncharacterized membrane protein YbhN (UPF0104 family)
VVVDRAADVLVLVVVLGATLPFIDVSRWVRNLALAALVLAALVAGSLAAARWYAHHSRRGRARAAPGAVRRSFLGRQLSGLVRGAARSLGPRDVPAVALLSALAWSAWACGAWLVASAVGLSLSPLELAFMTAVMNLGVALPSSPGFIGTYQWLAVAGLGLFEVGRTDAFAFSVLMHAVWFVPTTLAGVALAVWTAAPSTGLAARNAA